MFVSAEAHAQPRQPRQEEGCESSANSQRGRAAGMIGGLATGLLTREMRNRGVDPDYAFQQSMAAFLSTAIACALSPREQQQAADSEVAALNSGQTGTRSRRGWQSGERQNVSGGSEVQQRDGECAVTRTFVTDENGEEIEVRRRRCRRADGTWDDGAPV